MKIITDLFFIFLFRQSLNSGITLHIQSNLIWTSHISVASHVSTFVRVALRTEAAGTLSFPVFSLCLLGCQPPWSPILSFSIREERPPLHVPVKALLGN